MRTHKFANILLISPEGLVLQHRDDKPDIYHPGKYGAFGGHIEMGEKPETAARRELAEETDLDAENIALESLGSFERPDITPSGLPIHKMVYGFLGLIEKSDFQVYEGQGAVILRRGEAEHPNITSITAIFIGRIISRIPC